MLSRLHTVGQLTILQIKIIANWLVGHSKVFVALKRTPMSCDPFWGAVEWRILNLNAYSENLEELQDAIMIKWTKFRKSVSRRASVTYQ